MASQLRGISKFVASLNDGPDYFVFFANYHNFAQPRINKPHNNSVNMANCSPLHIHNCNSHALFDTIAWGHFKASI